LALLNPFAPLFFLPLPFLLVGLVIVRAFSPWIVLPLLLLLLIFVWLYGALFWPRRTALPSADQSFTVMTFNLWWQSTRAETARVPLHNACIQPQEARHCTEGIRPGDARADSALDGAPDIVKPPGAPDIVAVQELMPHMAALLERELGCVYPYRVFDVGEEMDPPRRLGVLSRYPLTALDAEHLVAPDFRVQLVRVQMPQRSFLLYNIHPRATLIVRYLREEGPLAYKVRKSFAQRNHYFQRLLADIDRRREPVIVVGDFNSTDQGDAYRLMARQLQDAQRTAGWGFGHTFPMHGADLGNLPVPTRLMRLDMIFYSAGLTALACRVGRVHGESDHLPVLATFGWNA
jgi:endonuclease/exonuclease/phosphatase family metal-dependent hydrolase